VRGLLLTGSLARGTARADSDLDVLVVTSEQAADDGWRSAARPLPVDFSAQPRRSRRNRLGIGCHDQRRAPDGLGRQRDLPNPSLDLGTVQRHLDDLTIPADAPARIRAILRAPPRESLQRQLDLIDAILPYLEESR
jgi:hypothetical protein